MITAYHVTKTRGGLDAILASRTLHPGRNVTTKEMLVHLSLTRFRAGRYALDVIGADTNKAWIIEFQIPNDTVLEPDPSGDGKFYCGVWMVHQGVLAITIVSITHIPDVLAWEEHRISPAYEIRFV